MKRAVTATGGQKQVQGARAAANRRVVAVTGGQQHLERAVTKNTMTVAARERKQETESSSKRKATARGKQ